MCMDAELRITAGNVRSSSDSRFWGFQCFVVPLFSSLNELCIESFFLCASEAREVPCSYLPNFRIWGAT